MNTKSSFYNKNSNKPFIPAKFRPLYKLFTDMSIDERSVASKAHRDNLISDLKT